MGDITSFALDPKSRKALDELRTALNASSNAEVIRRALTLLQMAAKTTGNGGQVILREDGRDREIVMG
jgi:hypothetical protein